MSKGSLAGVSLHRGFDGLAEGAFPSPQRLASVRISLPRMHPLGPIPEVRSAGWEELFCYRQYFA
jgi:hypothetical protein